MSSGQNCIFCKIVAGEIPATKVYEDDRAMAFMDISPLNRGHLLVIPKQHTYNILEADPELYGYLCVVISRLSRAVQAAVNPDGMNVMQLNGEVAGQVVPHLHIHLVPRWHGDGLTISEWSPVAGKMDEISATADLIRSRIPSER